MTLLHFLFTISLQGFIWGLSYVISNGTSWWSGIYWQRTGVNSPSFLPFELSFVLVVWFSYITLIDFHATPFCIQCKWQSHYQCTQTLFGKGDLSSLFFLVLGDDRHWTLSRKRSMTDHPFSWEAMMISKRSRNCMLTKPLRRVFFPLFFQAWFQNWIGYRTSVLSQHQTVAARVVEFWNWIGYRTYKFSIFVDAM